MALYRALLPLFIYVCRSALGQSVVEVEVGAPSVTLNGTVRPLVNVPSVRWSRGFEEVHVRVLKDDDLRKQNPLFTNRTQMNSDALESGNVSLELKNPTLTDSGTYTCVVREVIIEVKRFTVELRVKGLKVDVTEGSSSISLPFPLMRTLESEVSVKWTFGSEEVHLRRGGADDFSAQSGQFKGRTQMKPDALQRGDLSLELKDLTLSDSGHYTCVVTEGSTELARTTVHLTVEPLPDPVPVSLLLILLLLLLLLLLPVLLLVVLFLTRKRKKQTHEPDSKPVIITIIELLILVLLLILIALLISVVFLMKNQTHELLPDPVPVSLIISIVILFLLLVLLLVVLFLTDKRKKQTHEPDSKPVIITIIELLLLLLLIVLLIAVIILMKKETHEPDPVSLIIITIELLLVLLPLPVLLLVVLFLTEKRKKQTHESWTEALKGTVTCRPRPSASEIIEKLRVREEELRVKEEELRVKEEKLRVKEEELRVAEEELRVAEEERPFSS